MLQEQISQQFSHAHPMHQMARYHLDSGGKCLRGRLAKAEAQAVGLNPEMGLKWAIACELLHNATLIHDDIQDNDPIRRGQPSLWKKYGVAQAINAGDFLIFRAFKLTAQLGSPQLSERLAEVSEQLVRGQIDELDQIEYDNRNGYWSSYIKMAELKTGTLFQLPVHGIHILKSDTSSFDQERAWLDLGVCYQIIDDIQDCLGQKQTGQKQKDFQEKRINALVAWLSRSPQHQGLVDEYLEAPINSKTHQTITESLCQTLESSDVINQLQSVANEKLISFKNNTEKLTQNVVLEFLEPLTQKWNLKL